MNVVRMAALAACVLFFAQIPIYVYGQDESADKGPASVQNPSCTHGSAAGHQSPCPVQGNGFCPVHGYGNCPQPGPGFGPALRQALKPSDHPYFGLQPIYQPMGFRPAERAYGRSFQPYFPRLRTMLVPDQAYMTTQPAPPMKTYTTRGPRDFFNPNPPSIGY